MENLHKVGGSNQRLRQAKNYLWQGLVNDASALFNDFPKKQASNFQNYLRKHRFRIPDYQLDQELGICIGSGSVESWIKQIGSRVKIVGALRESKKRISNVEASMCLFEPRYCPEYLYLVKNWDAPSCIEPIYPLPITHYFDKLMCLLN